LDDYFFLNKDGKIIQKNSEKKYKISDVLTRDKKIIMSKKEEVKIL
jgi:hypothetical protein